MSPRQDNGRLKRYTTPLTVWCYCTACLLAVHCGGIILGWAVLPVNLVSLSGTYEFAANIAQSSAWWHLVLGVRDLLPVAQGACAVYDVT